MGRRRLVLLVAALGVAFVAALAWLSLGQRAAGVEACVAFHGRSSCGRAWAATREDALRAAVDAACGPITKGVGESMQCRHRPPERVRDLAPGEDGAAPR